MHMHMHTHSTQPPLSPTALTARPGQCETPDDQSDGGLGVPCRQVFESSKYTVHVLGPVVPEEAEKPHLDYWQ